MEPWIDETVVRLNKSSWTTRSILFGPEHSIQQQQ
jgi:hypothetical protein